MPTLISSEVLSDQAQADGRRYVKYRFVVEDNLGGLHRYVVGPKLVPPDFDEVSDLSVEGAKLLDSLKALEAEAAIQQMEMGVNPLRDSRGNIIPTKFADYSFVVSKALHHFLSHEDPAVAVMARPYIDNLTDEQIMALMPCDAAMVAQIRQVAADWTDVETKIKTYKPLLEE